jgi:hypothetical protein
MDITPKGKLLLGITAIFAIYNLYEIALVASSSERGKINGYFDLLLPLLFAANLAWIIKRRNRTTFVSLLLCLVSVIGMVVMLGTISDTTF